MTTTTNLGERFVKFSLGSGSKRHFGVATVSTESRSWGEVTKVGSIDNPCGSGDRGWGGRRMTTAGNVNIILAETEIEAFAQFAILTNACDRCVDRAIARFTR